MFFEIRGENELLATLSIFLSGVIVSTASDKKNELQENEYKRNNEEK